MFILYCWYILFIIFILLIKIKVKCCWLIWYLNILSNKFCFCVDFNLKYLNLGIGRGDWWKWVGNLIIFFGGNCFKKWCGGVVVMKICEWFDFEVSCIVFDNCGFIDNGKVFILLINIVLKCCLNFNNWWIVVIIKWLLYCCLLDWCSIFICLLIKVFLIWWFILIIMFIWGDIIVILCFIWWVILIFLNIILVFFVFVMVYNKRLLLFFIVWMIVFEVYCCCFDNLKGNW